MIDYQHKRKNPYYLESQRYWRALSLIRDYPRLCAMRDDILHGTPSKDNVGGGQSGPGDPTAQRGIRLAKINDELSGLEAAIAKIPAKYRQAVLDNILLKIPRGYLAGKYGCSESTIQNYRSALLWHVADCLKIP